MQVSSEASPVYILPQTLSLENLTPLITSGNRLLLRLLERRIPLYLVRAAAASFSDSRLLNMLFVLGRSYLREDLRLVLETLP